MSRVIPDSEPEVFFAGTAGTSEAKVSKATNYSERLIKFVPAEVLAGYVSVSPLMGTVVSHSGKITFVAILVVLCLLAIPIHYRTLLGRTKRARKHILISQVAFLAWAYGIGGPFIALGWHHPAAAGLGLVAVTFLAPKFIKP